MRCVLCTSRDVTRCQQPDAVIARWAAKFCARIMWNCKIAFCTQSGALRKVVLLWRTCSVEGG